MDAAENLPEVEGPPTCIKHQEHEPTVHDQILAPWHPISSPRAEMTYEAVHQLSEIDGSPVNKTDATEARELDSGVVYEISAHTNPPTLLPRMSSLL